MNRTFSGLVHSKWLNDGRSMKLTADLIYTDRNGREWIAKSGSVVDGGSIPRMLWSIIGSPLVGKYRRATVIHDVYCQSKDRPHKSVHRVFNEMMKADDVPLFKRKLMYIGVKICGPSWRS